MKKAIALASVLLGLAIVVQAGASPTSATTGLPGSSATTGLAAGRNGYYRFPAIHGDTVVFTSEGDVWTVDVHGGLARRLTSH